MARLQLNLSDTSENLIARLMPLCDLRTKTDVVENALMLLGWAATEVSQGRTIAAIDEKSNLFKEISTPALEGARGFKERMGTPPDGVAASTSAPAIAASLKAAHSG